MKTTNNANLNKIMNKNNNKGVVVSMDQLKQTRTNEVLESVYNGTCELQTLLNIKENIIDMNKCEHPIKTMQLIYKAGSKVGEVTIDGQNMYMIDVTTEEGFAAFKEGLKQLKDKESHEAYKTVWLEGYNMFKQFSFETGQHYVYYVVTNKEIEMLCERIQAMSKNKMTIEDAKALQADLPPFVRAWQESSIDVSKDKDKVFNIAMNEVLGKTKTLSQLTKKFADNIDFGFDKVRKAKHLGKVLPNFEYANAEVANTEHVVDLMGHVNVALKETAINKLNDDLKELYAVADNNLYLPFVNDVQISRELACYIKSIYRICYASKSDDAKLTVDDYAMFRNVIYTTALEYGVDREDVIRVAIAAAMTTVYKDKDGAIITKDADVNKFRQFPVANIFPEEYVAIITDEPAYETLQPAEIIYNITRNIEDNEEIEFVNGVSVDGAIELFDTTFNGTLIELNGEFIQFKDIYAFDVVNALLVSENTFKETATKEELMRVKSGDKAACDKGEYLNKVVRTLNEATVSGANANLLIANGHYLCQFTANYKAVKGSVTIKDVKTFAPTENGQQQLFLILV